MNGSWVHGKTQHDQLQLLLVPPGSVALPSCRSDFHDTLNAWDTCPTVVCSGLLLVTSAGRHDGHWATFPARQTCLSTSQHNTRSKWMFWCRQLAQHPATDHTGGNIFWVPSWAHLLSDWGAVSIHSSAVVHVSDSGGRMVLELLRAAGLC